MYLLTEIKINSTNINYFYFSGVVIPTSTMNQGWRHFWKTGTHKNKLWFKWPSPDPIEKRVPFLLPHVQSGTALTIQPVRITRLEMKRFRVFRHFLCQILKISIPWFNKKVWQKDYIYKFEMLETITLRLHKKLGVISFNAVIQHDTT